MKSTLIVFCLLGALFTAQIATAEFENAKIQAKAPQSLESEPLTPNLMKGSTAIGGGLGVGYTSATSLIFDLYPSAEYFVFDRLSVGGSMQMKLSRDLDFLALGPSATYYFWQQESWASFAGAGVLFTHARFLPMDRVADRWAANARLGLNYFFDPAISFGPEVTLSRYLGATSPEEAAYGALLLKLSVFM